MLPIKNRCPGGRQWIAVYQSIITMVLILIRVQKTKSVGLPLNIGKNNFVIVAIVTFRGILGTLFSKDIRKRA